MSVMVSEVYEALVKAGVSENKTRLAAESIPVGKQLATKADIADLSNLIDPLVAKIETQKHILRALVALLVSAVDGGLIALSVRMFQS